MKYKVKYETMFPSEFDIALRRNPTAFLPIGSLEWHGHHNVLGLDSLKAWKILELVAQKTGGVVFPPLYIGIDNHFNHDTKKHPNKKYDCYNINKGLLVTLIEQYILDMIARGFTKIVILAGHYPNKEIAELAKDKIRNKNIKIIIGTEADFVESEKGDHAGKWETSLMMALYPKLVNLEDSCVGHDRLLEVTGNDPKYSTRVYGETQLNLIISGIISSLYCSQ